MTPVSHEPSEFAKQKHNLTHIPFQPWCTSCVKGKAQAEPHKRTERIIEDSALPVIQCDYLMMKDTEGTGGLKVLSMYVRTFGYSMSTVVETKSPTDMFATMWAVMPSLMKWAESVKSKRTERTVIRSSPRRSQWRNRKLSETVAGTSANNAGSYARTHEIQTLCRQRTDEMDCPTCSVAHFLVSEVVRYSPHSIVPWEDRIVENWWSLEKQFLHILQR